RFRILNQNPSYFIAWIISAIVFVVLIILRINPLFLLTDTSKYIEQVYDYKLDSCNNGTYEELINNIVVNQDWQSEIDMQGNVTVTVSGKSIADENINVVISFDINKEKVELRKYMYDEEILYSEFDTLQKAYCEI